jgi:signal peptidase II
VALTMDVLLVVAVVVVIDQATKYFVLAQPRTLAARASGLTIRPVRVVRPSFTQTRGRLSLIVTWMLAGASIAILIGLGAIDSRLARLGVGIALGGALGNLVDILRHRAVTDFIDLGWWPAFHLADVGIICGLALALWPVFS